MEVDVAAPHDDLPKPFAPCFVGNYADDKLQIVSSCLINAPTGTGKTRSACIFAMRTFTLLLQRIAAQRAIAEKSATQPDLTLPQTRYKIVFATRTVLLHEQAADSFKTFFEKNWLHQEPVDFVMQNTLAFKSNHVKKCNICGANVNEAESNAANMYCDRHCRFSIIFCTLDYLCKGNTNDSSEDSSDDESELDAEDLEIVRQLEANMQKQNKGQQVSDDDEDSSALQEDNVSSALQEDNVSSALQEDNVSSALQINECVAYIIDEAYVLSAAYVEKLKSCQHLVETFNGEETKIYPLLCLMGAMTQDASSKEKIMIDDKIEATTVCDFTCPVPPELPPQAIPQSTKQQCFRYRHQESTNSSFAYGSFTEDVEQEKQDNRANYQFEYVYTQMKKMLSQKEVFLTNKPEEYDDKKNNFFTQGLWFTFTESIFVRTDSALSMDSPEVTLMKHAHACFQNIVMEPQNQWATLGITSERKELPFFSNKEKSGDDDVDSYAIAYVMCSFVLKYLNRPRLVYCGPPKIREEIKQMLEKLDENKQYFTLDVPANECSLSCFHSNQTTLLNVSKLHDIAQKTTIPLFPVTSSSSKGSSASNFLTLLRNQWLTSPTFSFDIAETKEKQKLRFVDVYIDLLATAVLESGFDPARFLLVHAVNKNLPETSPSISQWYGRTRRCQKLLFTLGDRDFEDKVLFKSPEDVLDADFTKFKYFAVKHRMMLLKQQDQGTSIDLQKLARAISGSNLLPESLSKNLFTSIAHAHFLQSKSEQKINENQLRQLIAPAELRTIAQPLDMFGKIAFSKNIHFATKSIPRGWLLRAAPGQPTCFDMLRNYATMSACFERFPPAHITSPSSNEVDILTFAGVYFAEFTEDVAVCFLNSKPQTLSSLRTYSLPEQAAGHDGPAKVVIQRYLADEEFLSKSLCYPGKVVLLRDTLRCETTVFEMHNALEKFQKKIYDQEFSKDPNFMLQEHQPITITVEQLPFVVISSVAHAGVGVGPGSNLLPFGDFVLTTAGVAHIDEFTVIDEAALQSMNTPNYATQLRPNIKTSVDFIEANLAENVMLLWQKLSNGRRVQLREKVVKPRLCESVPVLVQHYFAKLPERQVKKQVLYASADHFAHKMVQLSVRSRMFYLQSFANNQNSVIAAEVFEAKKKTTIKYEVQQPVVALQASLGTDGLQSKMVGALHIAVSGASSKLPPDDFAFEFFAVGYKFVCRATGLLPSNVFCSECHPVAENAERGPVGVFVITKTINGAPVEFEFHYNVLSLVELLQPAPDPKFQIRAKNLMLGTFVKHIDLPASFHVQHTHVKSNEYIDALKLKLRERTRLAGGLRQIHHVVLKKGKSSIGPNETIMIEGKTRSKGRGALISTQSLANPKHQVLSCTKTNESVQRIFQYRKVVRQGFNYRKQNYQKQFTEDKSRYRIFAINPEGNVREVGHCIILSVDTTQFHSGQHYSGSIKCANNFLQHHAEYTQFLSKSIYDYGSFTQSKYLGVSALAASTRKNALTHDYALRAHLGFVVPKDPLTKKAIDIVELAQFALFQRKCHFLYSLEVMRNYVTNKYAPRQPDEKKPNTDQINFIQNFVLEPNFRNASIYDFSNEPGDNRTERKQEKRRNSDDVAEAAGAAAPAKPAKRAKSLKKKQQKRPYSGQKSAESAESAESAGPAKKRKPKPKPKKSPQNTNQDAEAELGQSDLFA